MRTKIIASIAILTGLVTVVLVILNRSPAFILVIGGLTTFLVLVLWDLPPKHKTFTYDDQVKGTAQARGGSGPPELPKPESHHRSKSQ